jgi:putative transposase
MPRVPRNTSKNGIYHIIMRGINRQSIFEDDEDSDKFIQTLQHYSGVSGYEVYAYCLMENHLHLLIKVGKEPLEQLMRRICGSYVYWYNRKYDRVGNLFQDRFKSEPVDNDVYFLTVLRYIYQNPVKAGLVKRVEQYKWSNYSEYIGNKKATSVNFILDMFSTDRGKAISHFVEHVNKPNDDVCLDMWEKHRITDEEARDIIKKLFSVDNAIEFQKINIVTRNAYLKELKENHNLSIRQIERLTGINRGIVLKA